VAGGLFDSKGSDLMEGNGWEQWKHHILSSLERIESVLAKIDERCITRVHDCFLEISKETDKDNNFFVSLTNRIVSLENKLSAIEVKLKIIGIIAGTIFTVLAGILLKQLFER